MTAPLPGMVPVARNRTQETLMATKPITATALATALVKKKAGWHTADTEVSKLDPEARARLLGAIPSAESASFMSAMAAAPMLAAAPGFAPAVDWRNKGGNHVSPVRNQGGCGACVSFGSVGVIESMAHIETGRWIDLSEADAHFCSSHGANCGGWWPDQCLDQVLARGVGDEAGFPYPQAFPANNIYGSPPQCKLDPNRAARITKITARHALGDATAAKNHLSNIGPVTGCLDVYDDFFHYGGGVYTHVSGAKAGGHCVLVIGYVEAEQCWIAKNSWDTSWGTAGFFKIAYGECKFDAYPFGTATGIVIPAAGPAWHGYEGLGGVITSKPSATSWGANRIDVVARGTDSACYHRWWDGANWQGWESLGGSLQGAPAICSWAAGRLDIFVVGTDHRLYHKWFQGGWSGWENLGGLLSSDPCAVSWGPNRIDVFARGMDSAMWHLWWDGNHWAGWESQGGVCDSAPAVSSWAANRLDCFVKGTDSSLYHKWWNGSAWSGWENLHGYVGGDPGAESWGPNRIDVFYPGASFHMMHKWWNGSTWSGEEDLGGVLSSGVGVSSWAAGRLDCFVEGTDSAMYHKWYA